MGNDELWRRIKSLQGQTVSTGARRRSFHVESVSDGDARIRSASGQQDVPRAVIEAAYALGRRSDALRPEEIRLIKISDYDPTYIVGLLTAIGADRES